MEKILNTTGLGVAGRQNELIELALTFRFSTVQVDMNDLIGRHDTMGKEFACQFLQSAKIDIGAFLLPLDLDADDSEFNAQCEKLDTILSLCEALGAKRCRLPVATSSDEAFQANFERHRTRLHDLGERFASHSMSIGLMLQSPGANEKDNKFIHTAEEILTLVKTVGHDSVGLCLDTWQWRASGGGMDQISDIDPGKITELMMADLSEAADPAKIQPSDRVLPGESGESFALDVFNHLKAAGFDGPISMSTHNSTYTKTTRDNVINRISHTLDRMIAGEPLDTPIPDFRNTGEADAEEKKSDESADGESEEKKDDAKAETADKADTNDKKEEAATAAAS